MKSLGRIVERALLTRLKSGEIDGSRLIDDYELALKLLDQ
jgi:hypothetical protein